MSAVLNAAWVEGCLLEEYTLLSLLSQKETGEVSLWQHNRLGRRILLRRCAASLLRLGAIWL